MDNYGVDFLTFEQQGVSQSYLRYCTISVTRKTEKCERHCELPNWMSKSDSCHKLKIEFKAHFCHGVKKIMAYLRELRFSEQLTAHKKFK